MLLILIILFYVLGLLFLSNLLDWMHLLISAAHISVLLKPKICYKKYILFANQYLIFLLVN